LGAIFRLGEMRRNEIRSQPTRCRPHNRFNYTTAGGDITQSMALTSFSSSSSSSFSYWLDGFGGDRHRDCRRPMSWLSGCRWGAWRSISSSVPHRRVMCSSASIPGRGIVEGVQGRSREREAKGALEMVVRILLDSVYRAACRLVNGEETGRGNAVPLFQRG
jgi:hypothetical protein